MTCHDNPVMTAFDYTINALCKDCSINTSENFKICFIELCLQTTGFVVERICKRNIFWL